MVGLIWRDDHRGRYMSAPASSLDGASPRGARGVSVATWRLLLPRAMREVGGRG